MIRAINVLLVFTGCIITFSSCNARKNLSVNAKENDFTYNYCDPTIPYQQSADLIKNVPELSLSETGISKHDELICHMLKISSAVDSLWLLDNKKISPDAYILVLLKQRITGKLFVAQSQLQAVAAELDCEGERSNQAANYLDAFNNKRKTNLTVASVVTGALTTVGTVTVSKKPLQTIIAVGGGLLSAGLGSLTINPKGKRIKFYDKRNLLGAVFIDSMANKEYPYFVWLALHQKAFSNQGNITLSKSIRKQVA